LYAEKIISGTREKQRYQDKALPFRPQYLVDPLRDQKKNIIRNKVKPKIVHKITMMKYTSSSSTLLVPSVSAAKELAAKNQYLMTGL
jgi:late competence protein required for DNA uptake (superfamily II DNA/RNA helicase)